MYILESFKCYKKEVNEYNKCNTQCVPNHMLILQFFTVHMYIASVTLKKYVFCEGKPNYLGGPGQQANCEPVCLLF